MSAKVDEGLSYTSYGYPSLLLKIKDDYNWTAISNGLIELVDDEDRWKFIEDEDEHLIEGAALVAPLPILFWEKE